MRIGWIGLGALGVPCALTLAKHGGHQVTGYDIREPQVPTYEAGADQLDLSAVTLATSVGEVVATSDVVFVAVQTPHAPAYGGEKPAPAERRDFEYGYLVNACRAVCDAAGWQRKHITLAVVSTVLPGTCNRLIRPMLNQYVALVYNPAFIALGTTVQDFLDPEFVLMGADQPHLCEPVREVYESLHNKPVLKTNVDTAELAKVAYNVFVSNKIVFANTVMEICHKTGADSDAVIDALSMATDRVVSPAYMRGGMGDGGACFPPGQIVITEHGPRPIESVEVGDKVYTMDGTLQSVLRTWCRDYAGDLVAVQAEGLPETKMTADHPVMARRDLRKRMGNGRKPTVSFPRSDVAETPARDLTRDHLVLFPTPDIEVPLPAHATPEYLELAGWWLAEGSAYFDDHKNAGRLMWALHEKEAAYGERIAELIAMCAPPRPNGRGGNARISIQINHEHKQRNVRFGSRQLADRIVGDFGRLQHERFLPPWALWGDQKTAVLLLEGMLKGDGHINEHGVSYSTVSEHLAWGVFVLTTKLGFRPVLHSIPPRTGRDGVHHRHAYEVCVRNRAQARDLFALVNIDAAPRGQHEVHVDAWRPVRQVKTECYAGPVHNLMVAGTSTFVTSVGAVHNCHPRDLIAMSWLADRLDLSYDLLGDMAAAREAQTGWLADLTQNWADQTGLDICILGTAYKPGVPLEHGSSALLLKHQLEQRRPVSRYVATFDPHVDPDPPPMADLFGRPHVYVIGCKHADFRDYEYPAGSVVIDPHGYIPDRAGITVIRVGRKG